MTTTHPAFHHAQGLPAGFHDEPLVPPPPKGMIGELRLARELPRLIRRSRRLLSAQRGSGAPVMLLPGIGTGDAATAPLRAYLRWLGHDAHGWGLGKNHGDVYELMPQVLERVSELERQSGQPVHLVGWSLGGVIAREAGREAPEATAQIITYGTPVVGGPMYTVAAGGYGEDMVRQISAHVHERNQTPIQTPITAFFTRRDAVVAWRACIDPYNPHTDHVEVDSTHMGLGVNADVWLGIADRLARPRK